MAVRTTEFEIRARTHSTANIMIRKTSKRGEYIEYETEQQYIVCWWYKNSFAASGEKIICWLVVDNEYYEGAEMRALRDYPLLTLICTMHDDLFAE